MFTLKIPNMFIDLLVEVAATDQVDTQSWIVADRVRDWMYKHCNSKEYNEISNRIGKRRSQLICEREKKKDAEEKKLQNLTKAHVITVPKEIAEEAIKLWKYFEESGKNDMLTEYRFEHLILENCPGFKEFNGIDYELAVANGELLITEVFED